MSAFFVLTVAEVRNQRERLGMATELMFLTLLFQAGFSIIYPLLKKVRQI
jgi:hypothetical protein